MPSLVCLSALYLYIACSFACNFGIEMFSVRHPLGPQNPDVIAVKSNAIEIS